MTAAVDAAQVTLPPGDDDFEEQIDEKQQHQVVGYGVQCG